MDLKKEIAELTPNLIAFRRDFHAHPEVGTQEFRTAQKIEDELKSLGMEVRRCLPTGVIGVLKGGKPGKTLCLRSDIITVEAAVSLILDFASAKAKKSDI